MVYDRKCNGEMWLELLYGRRKMDWVFYWILLESPSTDWCNQNSSNASGKPDKGKILTLRPSKYELAVVGLGSLEGVWPSLVARYPPETPSPPELWPKGSLLHSRGFRMRDGGHEEESMFVMKEGEERKGDRNEREAKGGKIYFFFFFFHK